MIKYFKDNLIELLREREIDAQDFLEDLGLSKNYLYDTDKHSTTLPHAVVIANKLNVSIDFLCGRNLENEAQNKTRDCNNFVTNLLVSLKQSQISQRKFCTDLTFSRDCFTRWRKTSFPYLETVVSIANYLDCQIDELLI